MKYIKEYLFKARWAIAAMVIITFIAHGAILFSQSFGIDTDLIINGEHNFDRIGRQGLIWLAKLLDLDWFNLYYAQVLTFCFMALAPVSFGYLLYRLGGAAQDRANLSLLALGVSFVVSPFWVTQVYFLNQSAQVLLACTLIAVSILLAEHARTDIRHRWHYILLAVVLTQAAFACYQILVMVYVTGVAAAFLASSLKEERTVRRQLQWIGYHAGVFAVGFGVYLLIAQMFFMSGKVYLENQIAWGEVGLAEGLRQCAEAVVESLGNNPPYYTGLYGVFSALLIILTLCRIAQNGKLKMGSSVIFLLAEFFLIISPYVFIFFYGKGIADRMQLVMPLSQGCILYLAVLLLPRADECKTGMKKLAAWGILLAFAAACYKDTVSHLHYCNRFYYAYDWVFEYDAKIAERLYFDIREEKIACGLEDSYDKILFLGYPEIPYNSSCIRAVAMGASLFQIDLREAAPYRSRILSLMRNLGYPIECNYTDQEIVDHRAYFMDYFGERVDEMPSYPDRGYIQYLKDDASGMEYLVIKLGGIWRYDKL